MRNLPGAQWWATWACNTSISRFAILAFLMSGAVGVIGCASAPTQHSTATHVPTSSVATGAQATTTPGAATLPTLRPEQGWQATMTLGDQVSGGTINDGGSFTATGPYQIEWICVGTGTLTITYGSTTQTTTCTASPQLYGTGTLTPHPVGQQVTISVNAAGDLQWEGIVELQG